MYRTTTIAVVASLLLAASFQHHSEAQPVAERVQDINTGASDSSPERFIEYKGKLYFIATSPADGRELWRTDGTSGGTERVSDINSAGDSFNVGERAMIVFNGQLFFVATDGGTGRELYAYDGSSVERVVDLNPGAGGSDPRGFAIANGTLFFVADDGSAQTAPNSERRPTEFQLIL